MERCESGLIMRKRGVVEWLRLLSNENETLFIPCVRWAWLNTLQVAITWCQMCLDDPVQVLASFSTLYAWPPPSFHHVFGSAVGG